MMMLDLKVLTALFDHFGGSPTLWPERCLNARHKAAGCDKCWDTCPSGAITAADPVALDADLCAACGLCRHLCPSGAFIQSDEDERRLLEVLDDLAPGPVELVCPRWSAAGEMGAAVEQVVVTARCLAGLSLATLLEIGARRRAHLWLDDTLCAACPIGQVSSAFRQTAAQATYLLAAFEIPSSIHLSSQGDTSPRPPRLRPPMRGDQPRYSRRQFLTSLKRSFQKAAVAVVAEKQRRKRARRFVPVEERLPQVVPPARNRLLHALQRLGQAEGAISTAGLPLAFVVLAAECTACGWCARFCPTGALRFQAVEGRFTLSFQARLCLDCGLCGLACPAGAVGFGESVPLAWLTDPTPRPLLSGPLVACSECGQPTAARTGALCFVCRAQKARLADLMAGIRGG